MDIPNSFPGNILSLHRAILQWDQLCMFDLRCSSICPTSHSVRCCFFPQMLLYSISLIPISTIRRKPQEINKELQFETTMYKSRVKYSHLLWELHLSCQIFAIPRIPYPKTYLVHNFCLNSFFCSMQHQNWIILNINLLYYFILMVDKKYYLLIIILMLIP